MYARCRELGCARKVFDEIADRDLVSWNSMIYGCVKTGFAKGALELFKEMKRDGFEPDEMTVVSMLGACRDLGLGKVVEEYVVENEMEVNSYVGLALIGMYSKCGDLVSGRRVFDKIGRKDLVTWNAMITGFCIVFTSFELSVVVPVGAYVSGGHVKAGHVKATQWSKEGSLQEGTGIVLQDAAADPGLPRTKPVCCVQRGHGQAIFFLRTAVIKK
ncbi:pentatricopeptide repeat-containing protein [Tanacetum coccineum]